MHGKIQESTTAGKGKVMQLATGFGKLLINHIDGRFDKIFDLFKEVFSGQAIKTQAIPNKIAADFRLGLISARDDPDITTMKGEIVYVHPS